jgi:hypothetical protein
MGLLITINTIILIFNFITLFASIATLFTPAYTYFHRDEKRLVYMIIVISLLAMLLFGYDVYYLILAKKNF